MNKILITGGGGFLGRFVARQLRDLNNDVTILGRSPYPFMEKEGFKCIQADICCPDSMTKALNGYDEVHHIASLTGISVIREPFYRINVIGTKNIIDACIKNNIGKLIYTSSPSVVYYQDSNKPITEDTPYPENFLSYYPETKAIAEKMVLEANQPGKLLTVSLRPHLIWGPEDTNLIPRLLQRASSGKLRIVGKGNNLVDVTYVTNAAKAHCLASEKLKVGSPICGNAYFITNDEPVRLWDFINKIVTGVGIKKIEKKISYSTAKSLGIFFEFIYSLFKISAEPPMTRFLASQLATTHIYSCEKAKTDLGYKPETTVEKGLVHLLDYLKNSKSKHK
ncbi:NAD-dependent epimerase/dehydratase family protein [bacterium]|nr:NAD-dependent epimerase/dehydratase family protein [bacterium]